MSEYKKRLTHDEQPTVIPLQETTDPTIPIIIDEPWLLSQAPADTPGRFASFADYHNLYKSGAATPLQVVEALLPLINRNAETPTEYSVAWLDIHEEEVLAAARTSTERYAAGQDLGILDGIPFGVKADLDVEGYVNTMGMKVDERHGYFTKPSTHTLWPIRKLMEQGAIMVGKMNQHEVGMDTTGCNPNTGTPINFYNKAYYPGGSSSGGGSALGAGLVPLCVGTDAGGSIRIPASTAGCLALKPTHNRTLVMSSSMCIVGPMCANIADLTIAYRVMAQANPHDPITSLFAPSIPPSISEDKKKYLGVCRPWLDRAKADVRAVFDKAIAWYTTPIPHGPGYGVIEIDLPLMQEGQTAHGAINLAEAADKAKARHRVVHDEDNGKTTRGGSGRWTDLLSYANAITCSVGGQTTANDYMRFAQVRSVIMRHLTFLFEKYGEDFLIVSPVAPDAAYPRMKNDDWLGFTDGNRTLRSMTYVWLSNMSGCPSATAPIGYVDPPHLDKKRTGVEMNIKKLQDDKGVLPVGMLAMGMWGQEERLLDWAHEGEWYLRQHYTGGRVKPEGWVDVIAKAQEEDVVKKDGGEGVVKSVEE